MSKQKTLNALENYKLSVGCFLKEGKLQPAYACVNVTASLPSGTKYIAYSDAVKKYCACTKGTIYLSDDGVNYTSKCNLGGFSPYMLEEYFEGAPRTVFISGQVAVACTADASAVGVMLQDFDCAVAHCGRVFGAKGLTLRWSGSGGYNDWAEGLNASGWLQLDPARGNVLDLKVFSGKLIAVREYGLTTLEMFGSPENFSVGITDCDCEKIYKNTTCILGDKLYFYSLSGLKSFDGTKISSHKLRHAASVPVSAGGFEGKYFLACTSDDLKRKAVLCVDTSDFESCLIDEAADVVFVKDAVYLYGANGLKKLVNGGKYRFESGKIDFGTGRNKTLIKLDVLGSADIAVSNGVHTRLFSGASGVVRPHLKGKWFSVTAEGSAEVRALLATAEVTDAI